MLLGFCWRWLSAVGARARFQGPRRRTFDAWGPNGLFRHRFVTRERARVSVGRQAACRDVEGRPAPRRKFDALRRLRPAPPGTGEPLLFQPAPGLRPPA